MLNKKIIFLLLITFFSISHSHKIPGILVETKKIKNNKIHIKALFKRSKKPLVGNEVRLISMFDNRILKKGNLAYKGIVFDIPKESYWIYVLVRDNDIVVDGLSPDEGFQKTIEKEEIALIYTFILSLFFILLSIFIGYKRNKSFNQSL